MNITDEGFGSCDVYYMKPGGIEKKHYHDGIEIVHVIKGNCIFNLKLGYRIEREVL